MSDRPIGPSSLHIISSFILILSCLVAQVKSKPWWRHSLTPQQCPAQCLLLSRHVESRRDVTWRDVVCWYNHVTSCRVLFRPVEKKWTLKPHIMYINEVFFIEYAAIDDNLLWNYYDSAILWWRSIILTFIICPIDVMCYAVLCQDCWSYLKC